MFKIFGDPGLLQHTPRKQFYYFLFQFNGLVVVPVQRVDWRKTRPDGRRYQGRRDLGDN